VDADKGVATPPRGESGIFDRGLFVNDDADIDGPVVSCCHSAVFDFVALIPRLCLDPYEDVSLSLGDRFNELMRLQSFENTSRTL
jgi:hypothetical protein